jgi:hypothetical protein
MVTDIINSVDSIIRLALTGITSNIFFYELPNTEMLEQFTVTYEVDNNEPDATFTNAEQVATYNVQVKLNGKKRTEVITNSIYVRSAFKNLIGKSTFRTIVLGNEQFIWDDELKVYTNNLNYKIQF